MYSVSPIFNQFSYLIIKSVWYKSPSISSSPSPIVAPRGVPVILPFSNPSYNSSLYPSICPLRIPSKKLVIGPVIYKPNDPPTISGISEDISPSSTPIVKYTSKKTISGRSPFYVDNQAWYYDTNDNVAYLKTCISKRDLAYSYSFTVNPSYFYIPPTASFTERMIVQVSYSLEVIQANRAKAVWGKDPSTLS